MGDRTKSRRRWFSARTERAGSFALQAADRNSTVLIDSNGGPVVVTVPPLRWTSGAYVQFIAKNAQAAGVSFVFTDNSESVNGVAPPSAPVLTRAGAGFLLVRAGPGAWTAVNYSDGKDGAGVGTTFNTAMGNNQLFTAGGPAGTLLFAAEPANSTYAYNAAAGELTLLVGGCFRVESLILALRQGAGSGVLEHRIQASSGGPFVTIGVIGVGRLNSDDPESRLAQAFYDASAGDRLRVEAEVTMGANNVVVQQTSNFSAVRFTR